MPTAELQPIVDRASPIVTTVTGLVNTGFSTAQGYAHTAFGTAVDTLDEMEQLAATIANLLPAVDVTVTAPASTVSGYVSPDAPAEPDGLTFTPPASPTAPALPTVSALTLPGVPSAPSELFEFSESGYSTALLTTLRALLTEWVEGANTGIDSVVEAAIWQRARDREVQTRLAAEDDVLNLFASRGYRKPPGAMSIELQRAAQAAQTQDISTSREISVQQAQLEQTNRHKAIEAVINSEGQLIAYQGNVAQRTFDAARLAKQLPIEVFRARMDGFRAQVEGTARAKEIEIEALVKLPLEIYKSQADVFKALTDAEGARTAAIAKVYETRGRIFEAMSKGEADRVDAEVRVYAANVSLTVEEARLRVQAAAQNGQITTQKYAALGQILDAMGRVAAQIAAGALSGVHLSAALSASGSASFNMGQSNSTSLSASATSSETTSTSTSTSSSTSVTENHNFTGE